MRPGTRPGVAVAAALLLTSGCAGEPEPSDPLTRVGTRSYQSVTWDTVFLVGGTVDDSLLFMPRLLAGRGDLLYAFDYGDQQLKAFGSDGELRWRHGGAGSGPGEFRNPLDLEVDPNGDVWVFDGGTGRLTAFSADGEMLRTVSPGLAIRDVVKVRDRLFVLPVMEGDEYWVQLAMDGSRVGSGGFPTTELADAAPMVRQTLAVRPHRRRGDVLPCLRGSRPGDPRLAPRRSISLSPPLSAASARRSFAGRVRHRGEQCCSGGWRTAGGCRAGACC
jgi:hypothetical protein